MLASEGLHDGVAGERLVDNGVELAGAAPLGDVTGPGAPRDLAHCEYRDWDGGQGDQGQQRRDGEHHDRHADEQKDGVKHLTERLLQALGDIVDVVGDPAEQITSRCPVDVAEGQGMDFFLYGLAQSLHDSLQDTGQSVSTCQGEEGGADVHSRGFQQDVMQFGEVDVAVADTFNDDVGPVAQDSRPEHVEGHADDGGEDGKGEFQPLV